MFLMCSHLYEAFVQGHTFGELNLFFTTKRRSHIKIVFHGDKTKNALQAIQNHSPSQSLHYLLMLTELQLLIFMTYGALDDTLVCALTLAAPSADDVNAVPVTLLEEIARRT